MNKTALNISHIELGAKMVNFSNWEMPISYTSLIEEHNAVRNTAGIFDVCLTCQFLILMVEISCVL